MLPSLVAAFATGLVVGSFVPYFPVSVSCLLLLAAIASCVPERSDRAFVREATILFCSMLIGMLYWSWVVERPGQIHGLWQAPETVQDVSGRIVEPVQQAPDRFIMMIAPDGVSGELPRQIRLTWRAPERAVFHGDRIRFRSKLRLPSGSLNPGGFDYAAYLERQGVDAVATVSGAQAVELLESGRGDRRWRVWNQFDRWRGAIRTAAIQSLPQPALGIYLGIILGDRGYLDTEVRDRFMVSGTVHLLSISGSHLGLVAILTFVLIRRALLLFPAAWLLRLSRTVIPTRLAALGTVLPVTLYACLAGAELATMRSLFMVLVALLARWLSYEQRILHALALAGALILVHDPQAVYDISFQLSFLSVWAIAAWLSRPTDDDEQVPDRNRLRKGLHWGKDAIVMSAVITLTTLPLVAFYFNQFPWLGIVTNLFAVPVMGLVLVPVGLFAAGWQLIDGGTALPLAPSLQWLIERFIEGLSFVATVPGGEWHVASPAIPLMLVFYGLLAQFRVNRRSASCRWTAGVAVAVLVLWWGWSPRLSLDGNHFRITFLDVAQGDSTVLELPDGQVVLIDGGATYERFDMGRGVVGPYLWNRGIRSLDHVIATHPQLDHIGGLAWVVQHFAVGSFWGLGLARDEIFYHRLEKALALRGVSERIARTGQLIELSPDCRLLIENPPDPLPFPIPGRKEGQGLNNRSIVTRLTCGVHTALFPADVERETLARMMAEHPEPVEVLKVPHHGAASSLSREWVASLHPRYAVISAGRHNPYGHPAASVIQAYQAEGIPLWRTDRDGGVWITGSRSDRILQFHATRSHGMKPIDLASGWESEIANWKCLTEQWFQRL